MNQPRRAENPKKFLDASLVPLERSLYSRAELLEKSTQHGLDLESERVQKMWLASEFRKLAEELHHW